MRTARRSDTSAAHEPREPRGARGARPDRAAGPRPVADERRTRVRLRELCDEVLASFRVARERDFLSPAEREQAHTMLRRLAPLGR